MSELEVCAILLTLRAGIEIFFANEHPAEAEWPIRLLFARSLAAGVTDRVWNVADPSSVRAVRIRPSVALRWE